MAEGDIHFQVHLVIPASIADLLDEDCTVDEAIAFAHRYMHEAGEGDAPYLQPTTLLWPQGERIECQNTVVFDVKPPWHGVPYPELPDILAEFDEHVSEAEDEAWTQQRERNDD